MTTVRLYACLTAMMQSLNNILIALMLNIILFWCKSLRQLHTFTGGDTLFLMQLLIIPFIYPMGYITAGMTLHICHLCAEYF